VTSYLLFLLVKNVARHSDVRTSRVKSVSLEHTYLELRTGVPENGA
jgi:hypothetical protein